MSELKNISQFEKDFSKGYICACANMMRMYGESTMVEETLRGNFLSVKEMKNIGVDDNDIEILRPIIDEIERKHKLLIINGK